MIFNYDEKISWLLVFFFHHIILGVLLLLRYIKNRSSIAGWLGMFSFLCALYISPFMLGYAGWYSRQPYRDILFYLPLQQVLLLPPILYFYIRYLLDRSFRLRREHWLHFIPFISYLAYSMIVVITDKLILREYFFYADQRDKDLSFWYQATGTLSMLFYLILGYLGYQRYRKNSYDQISFADAVPFHWVRYSILAMILLIALRIVSFIIDPEWDHFGEKFWYYLSFSLVSYVFVLAGYSIPSRSAVSFAMTDNDSREDPTKIQQATTKTGMLRVEEWKAVIERTMLEDELFLDPELSLEQMAAHIDIHPKKLSQLINEGFGMNFNDLVNKYRVIEVIKRLEEGAYQKETILAIAFGAGFNSKATFNRAFKKHAGGTPMDLLTKLTTNRSQIMK